MTTALIGARIKALRKRRHLSQEDLARLFGFNDRQTVSAIETGNRQVTAEELLLAVERLDAPLRYFTDPFLLADDGRFSWRLARTGGRTALNDAELRDYEDRAGRWIAAYLHLATRLDLAPPPLRRTLGLTKQSSYEEAVWAGNRFAAEFDLGPVPARRLPQTMDERLGILFLMVDAPPEISGGACRLPRLDVALINRNETEGRRHFDLAHELFHLLTWDAMPPQHLEPVRGTTRDRAEQLADKFASAVLMPEKTLTQGGPWSDLALDTLIERLNSTAETLRVSSSALRWRLVDLLQISRQTARSLPPERLRNNGQPAVSRKGTTFVMRNYTPPPFSKKFLDVIARSLDVGLLSMRRAAKLLDCTIEGVEQLLASHGLTCPVEI